MLHLIHMPKALKAILLLLLTLHFKGVAQFYNGMDVEFGKNRVQYSEYLWSHYKYEQFNIYFYEEGKNIADYAARSAHLQIQEFEKLFQIKLQTKLEFVIYNTQNQSRESNIGNYPDEALNPGGFARIIGNKVFLYFDGNHKNLDRQIRSGVSQIIVHEVIYGDDFTDELRNGALINFPLWFEGGLTSYFSEKWSVEIEDKVKAGFSAGKFKKFNWLRGNDAILAGHAFWYFLADVYGEESVTNVLILSKLNHSIEDGVLIILGTSLEQLLIEYDNYFKSRFLNDNTLKAKPEPNNVKYKKLRKNRVYQRLTPNKTGDFYAYTSNQLSQQKVFVWDKKNNKQKRILKLGHKIDVVPDYSFPVLAWHPQGQLLSVFYEFKGELLWLTYNPSSGEKTKSKLFQFEKILEANYAQNGRKIALSAVVNGKTDIYVLDVSSRSQEQITNDFFDDRHPVFVENDRKILFSSNRDNDTMAVRGQQNFVYKHQTDLFTYDYANKKGFRYSPQVLMRVTNTPFANEKMPIALGGLVFQYLSDANGVYNTWQGEFDSAVAYVDTTVHYRYYANTFPTSNYTSGIKWHATNGKDYTTIFKAGKRFTMRTDSLRKTKVFQNLTTFKRNSSNYTPDAPAKEAVQKVITLDSIKNKMLRDPNFIYTDYYVFEDELNKPSSDSIIKVVKSTSNTAFKRLKISSFPFSDSLATKVKQRNYELAFKTAEVSLDLDNRFLNPQYQRYSGGGDFPMPGLNGFMKYAVIDLLEDHLITGGFRLANIFSHEFFLSYFNRKKRLDKQYLFYRGTHSDVNDNSSFTKNITYEGIYRLHYPLSIVDRFSATFSLRYDQSIPLSRNRNFLEESLAHQFWPNIRLDYTFDNSRSLGKNLMQGSRLKVFTEYYQEAPQWSNQMITYGADLRHYIPIYRSLIWANRIAGAASLGNQRLIYYLGGVDSWNGANFNNELAPSTLGGNDIYAFQALATNMRGFSQNVRNGSNFVAINSEIRWPVVKFLFARPFNSDFINNFQIIGFGDVGTAWSGTDLFSKTNSLNIQNIPLGGEANTGEIILRTNKEPIVGGFGAGLRTTIMGYFIRADWAWGVEDGVNQGRTFYLSFATDF